MRVAAILVCAITVVYGNVIVDIDVDVEIDLNGSSTESTEWGTESTKSGTESTEWGTESTKSGTESTEWGTESTKSGTESTESGTESNESDIELNENGCPIDATIQKFYPHKYCDMFYQCSNGELVERGCPGNLMYNKDTQECDWFWNVDCAGKNISESKPEQNEPEIEDEGDGTCNCDPAEAPEICAQSDSDGVLVAHEYCTRFYKCSGGQPIALRCPKTLTFNPYKNRCDWAENVECGNRTMPESDDDDDESAGDNNNGNDDAEIDGPINDNPAEASEICAREESEGVLVAHDYCNWFFNCRDGQPIAQKCPPGTNYNPRKERCDWPQNVECGNRTISESDDDESDDNNNGNDDAEIDGPINDNPAEASEICAREESEGVLVAHDYCNWFFNCRDGQPIAQKCPPGTNYNPRKERCDWPHNVECGNRTISESDDDESDDNNNGNDDAEIDGPINDNPAEASEICAREESDGVLVAHNYCNWFFNCRDGQPIAQKCPPGTNYNPRKERCDWPQNVECGNRTISESDDDESDDNNNGNDDAEIDGPINDNPAEASEICAQEESEGVLVAHEYCNWFFNCRDGQPVAQKCPTDLYFNPRKARCDWPQNVDCNRTISEPDDDQSDGNDNTTENDVEEVTGPVNDNPAEAASICAQDDTEGVLIAHENCDEFYICNLYAPVALRCGPGLHFNPRRQLCDWPENVDCGDRIIPERNDTQSEDDSEESCKNCDPSEASDICAREGSEGVLVAHENCNQYYKCNAGKPNVLRCINNLLYNAQKGWCDWPEQVDCGDRIVPDNEDSGNDNPAEASEICARAGSEGALVAHELCSKFYKCSHSEPMELQCQEGLLFNPQMGLCDWPSNVDCGDRQ